jgi:hypothetical protein
MLAHESTFYERQQPPSLLPPSLHYLAVADAHGRAYDPAPLECDECKGSF